MIVSVLKEAAATWKHRVVVAIFSAQENVEHAVAELKLAGFPIEDISVLVSVQKEPSPLARKHEQAGAVLEVRNNPNDALKWLRELGARAILTAGSINAAGPMAVALARTSLGGRTGDLVNALVTLGIHRDEAASFETYVRNGAFLLSVHPESSQRTKLAGELLAETATDLWSTDEIKQPQRGNRSLLPTCTELQN
jgi:hypothetical protein